MIIEIKLKDPKECDGCLFLVDTFPESHPTCLLIKKELEKPWLNDSVIRPQECIDKYDKLAMPGIDKKKLICILRNPYIECYGCKNLKNMTGIFEQAINEAFE